MASVRIESAGFRGGRQFEAVCCDGIMGADSVLMAVGVNVDAPGTLTFTPDECPDCDTPDAAPEGDAVEALLDRIDQRGGGYRDSDQWWAGTDRLVGTARAQHARRQEECTECCHEWEVGLAEAARTQAEAESENARLRKEREGERVFELMDQGGGIDSGKHYYHVHSDGTYIGVEIIVDAPRSDWEPWSARHIAIRPIEPKVEEQPTPDAAPEGDAVDDGGLLDIDLMSLAEEYLAGLRQDQKAGAACLVPIEVWSKAIAAARAQHARRQEECTECCHEWEVGLAEAARAQVEAESENERLRKEREGERVVGVWPKSEGELDTDWYVIPKGGGTGDCRRLTSGEAYCFFGDDVITDLSLPERYYAIRRVESEPKAKAKILRIHQLAGRQRIAEGDLFYCGCGEYLGNDAGRKSSPTCPNCERVIDWASIEGDDA